MSANAVRTPAAPQPRATRDLPGEGMGSRSPAWWGMIFFITTEATLFGALVSAYFYLAFGAARWPPAGIAPPDLRTPLLGTLLLLSGSVPVVVAERRIRRGDRRGLLVGLLIGFVLDAAFLALQVREYTRLAFTPRANEYGSLFWTITGLHMIHVAFALLMVAFLLVRIARGHFTAAQHLAVQNVGMYWHFVGAVWVVIFSSLYLFPQFT